jgi:hypothetical protein
LLLPFFWIFTHDDDTSVSGLGRTLFPPPVSSWNGRIGTVLYCSQHTLGTLYRRGTERLRTPADHRTNYSRVHDFLNVLMFTYLIPVVKPRTRLEGARCWVQSAVWTGAKASSCFPPATSIQMTVHAVHSSAPHLLVSHSNTKHTMTSTSSPPPEADAHTHLGRRQRHNC